ncbi:hypothetical protein [Streptomyces sp. NPDC005805]|uniref:hypothetical protein n=1 Tax=Streptomyces sp. NPDC005805 TaxID=3157068 RepID=UPI00340A4C81
MARTQERECAYCPRPGADVCIRVRAVSNGNGYSIYAHTACAQRRGVPLLYRVLEPEPEPEAGR